MYRSRIVDLSPEVTIATLLEMGLQEGMTRRATAVLLLRPLASFRFGQSSFLTLAALRVCMFFFRTSKRFPLLFSQLVPHVHDG